MVIGVGAFAYKRAKQVFGMWGPSSVRSCIQVRRVPLPTEVGPQVDKQLEALGIDLD